jgi:hypothetical protein
MSREVTAAQRTDCPIDAAWLRGLSVPTAYTAIRDLLPANGSVMVTALDSDRDLRNAVRLKERLSDAAVVPTPLGSGLVFAATDVSQLVSHRGYFVGFDELWVFPNAPSVPLPTNVVLTSEEPVAIDDDLARWMCAGCLVGLGDGDGLNFVTTDPRIAARLRAEDRRGDAADAGVGA